MNIAFISDLIFETTSKQRCIFCHFWRSSFSTFNMKKESFKESYITLLGTKCLSVVVLLILEFAFLSLSQ